MKISMIGSVLVTILALTACGGDKASFETLELQRSIANANSTFNATRWRAENGMGDSGILARGDSTQQADCPQGDGWASIDLTNATTKQVVLKLKCSTVSANVGCIKEIDFKDRAVLASQENKCNRDIPSGLPKIEK